jgi:phosphatidylethanolamine/phosphatidyl-N-methylethanolamine N-methyltransferase
MARQDKSSTALFLKELVLRPRQLGAIAPSSRFLAQAMAQWITPKSDGYVLELGPGTGAVTEALLNQGLSPNRLIAVEKSLILAEHLRERYPEATIIHGDAMELESLLKTHMPNALPLRVVISSLPLLNFPADCAEAIACGIQAVLGSQGRLVQFSYQILRTNPKLLRAFHLVNSRVVWRNLPPARVSVYQK